MKDDFTADYFSLQSACTKAIHQTAEVVLQFVWTLSLSCGVCLVSSRATCGQKEDNRPLEFADFLRPQAEILASK